MLARLITKGRVQEATEIVNGRDVQTVPVSEVDPEFIGEDTRVLAQIIRIKKGTGGKKKIVNKEGVHGKMMKLEHPYDRLVLCR